jgi:hypothetical protein
MRGWDDEMSISLSWEKGMFFQAFPVPIANTNMGHGWHLFPEKTFPGFLGPIIASS